jgi:hypothetical protein
VEHRRCVLRACTKNRKWQRLVVREHLAHGVGASSVVSTKLAARRAWAVQRGRAPGRRATRRPAVRRVGRTPGRWPSSTFAGPQEILIHPAQQGN